MSLPMKLASLGVSFGCVSDWLSGHGFNLCQEDWSGNIFCNRSLPFHNSRKAFVSFWHKNVHKYWLTTLRTKPAQEKCVGKLTGSKLP